MTSILMFDATYLHGNTARQTMSHTFLCRCAACTGHYSKHRLLFMYRYQYTRALRVLTMRLFASKGQPQRTTMKVQVANDLVMGPVTGPLASECC